MQVLSESYRVYEGFALLPHWPLCSLLILSGTFCSAAAYIMTGCIVVNVSMNLFTVSVMLVGIISTILDVCSTKPQAILYFMMMTV